MCSRSAKADPTIAAIFVYIGAHARTPRHLGGKQSRHKLQQSGSVIKHILYLRCANCSNAENGSATRERNIFAVGTKITKEQAHSTSRKVLLLWCGRFSRAGVKYWVENLKKLTTRWTNTRPQKWHVSMNMQQPHTLLKYFSCTHDASNPRKEPTQQFVSSSSSHLSARSCMPLASTGFKSLPPFPVALHVSEVRFILQRLHSRRLHWEFYWNFE